MAWKTYRPFLCLLYVIVSVLCFSSGTSYTSIEKNIFNLTSDIASKFSGTTIG